MRNLFLILLSLCFSNLVQADANCKMAPATVTVGPVGFDDTFVEYGLGSSYIPITIAPHTASGTCKHAIVHMSVPSYPVLQNMGATVISGSTVSANFRIYFHAKDFPFPVGLTYDFHDVDRVDTGIYTDVPVVISQ